MCPVAAQTKAVGLSFPAGARRKVAGALLRVSILPAAVLLRVPVLPAALLLEEALLRVVVRRKAVALRFLREVLPLVAAFPVAVSRFLPD